jgi:hypothetical protein
MENKTENKKAKVITLEEILARGTEELTQLEEGEFFAKKLGTVLFTSVTQDELRKCKARSKSKVENGTGGFDFEVDDDKLRVNLVIDAVDKDTRSNFTFASKALLEKLGVTTAAQAVNALMRPGEIFDAAVKIQEASGFGDKAEEETREAVKN